MTRHTLRLTATACLLMVTPSAALEHPADRHGVPAIPAPAPSPATPPEYVIGPDDVLHVSVWRDPDLSVDVVVRPDGRISLPLLRDVTAMGLTPDALADRVQVLAATYLERPAVTVVVKQINSRRVFITGEVGKPGAYPLSGTTSVLQLIATAGGLTPYAKQSRIVILRPGSTGQQTISFDYRKVAGRQGAATNVLLLPGDTVLVP